jgi:hypothetical protein
MGSTPDPAWPVIVLAVIQLADAFFCLRPLPFVRDCLEGVRFPPRHWWLLTPIKLAAGAGLLAGLVVPYLAAVVTTALVAYFLIAIGMHLRAHDLGRNLCLNASGMLATCLLVGYVSVL